MRSLRLVAVDLGATSGRIMVGTVAPGRLDLEEVHRFPNGPVRVGHGCGSQLLWDILGIYRETVAGIGIAHRGGPLDGIGIDSWAVDYGLLAADGSLLGNPVTYRDARTDGVMERVLRSLTRREMYDVTGLQQLRFNTIYQLVSAKGTAQLDAADTLLLIPDLVGYWLTGRAGAEITNASTTQLFDVGTRAWATALAERVGVPWRILPELREPGDVVGPVLPEVAALIGLDDAVPVIAVGSHDTASAVVAVPAAPGTSFAYISSGTWSLVGLELDQPVLSDEAMDANFTNEGGVDATVRFLRNVMGLWVLSETMQAWSARGTGVQLPALLDAAAGSTPFRSVIDIDAPEFLAPGDMTARIAAACRAYGQRAPDTPGEMARCILESLALAYRRNVRLASALSGHAVDVIHLVGGGVRNRLLCQLTADACGLPVLAGPVEAAAMGNVLVQARALGADLPDLASMRALVAQTSQVRRYEPTGDRAKWDAVEARIHPDRNEGPRP
jgi:rhamnulokinase